MANQKLLKTLNNIFDLFSYGFDRSNLSNASRTFGLGSEHQLSLNTDNEKKFNLYLTDLLNEIPTAKNTISTDKLIEELIPLVRQKKIDNSRITLDECHFFQQHLISIPVEKYRILRDIYGIVLTPNAPPIHFGIFKIYDPKSHLDQIAKELNGSGFKFKTSAELLIECTVEARDNVKAKEIADVLFHKFELIIHFFIGQRTSRFEVGILNYVGPQMRNYFVISKKICSEGTAWQGAVESIPIENPFFSNPPPALAKLLKLIEKQGNQFETHIVRCAEWTAQAMRDPNAASAFVKAAIALEVLFSITEKGVITSSIMAQIAEGCAFILGDSPESAAKIEREVKRLYGIRSSIVHSGKDSVPSVDLNAFIQICRNTVIGLLSSNEFEQIKDMEKLAEYFKAKKYASIKSGANET